MNFFEFLASHSKVETVIGLLSFIVAAVLGYFAYINTVKLKSVGKIISNADTENKAGLAASILEVLPSYKIPDLNQKQGFEIVKLQLAQKEKQFESKIKLLRLGIVIFSILVIIILGKNFFHYESYSTTGPISPIVHGDSAIITIKADSKDTIK